MERLACSGRSRNRLFSDTVVVAAVLSGWRGGEDVAGLSLGQHDIVLAWTAKGHEIALPMTELAPIADGGGAVVN